MIFIPRNDLKLWISCTNQVWNLVDSFEWIKLNESKWIFKIKTNMKGTVQIYYASFKEYEYPILTA
jgi:hypothetical protein